MNDLERIIRPLVEGQLRTFGHAHPAVVEAVDWRHSHPTKLDAFVASTAKRITTALLAGQTADRLRSALSVGVAGTEESRTSEPSSDREPGSSSENPSRDVNRLGHPEALMTEDLRYYRYENTRRGTGGVDIHGEWEPGPSYTIVVLHTYRVEKKTPKGARLTSGRFVLDGEGKRFAHQTKELALASFIARKKRQALILRGQLSAVETALSIAERGVDCHERSPFDL